MQTLLQLFKQDGKIPRGKAVDYPKIAMRGFMMDVARDFFEVEYIESVIRKLAWMKMNFIDIHFTDREAFRLKSDLFPGLAHPTEHLPPIGNLKAYIPILAWGLRGTSLR